MLDHLALQCASAAESSAFYQEVFAALGVHEAMRFERPEGLVIGLAGSDGFPRLWLGPLIDRGRRPVHCALTAASRSAVDEVEAAARARDAEVLHPARIWPEYHPAYYGVFLRDPDGNNVEGVCHLPQ